MSDQEQNEERTDREIAAALEVLEHEASTSPGSEEIRPWLELLGLLPQELDPVVPPPSVKDSLMREIDRRAGGANVEPFVAPDEARAVDRAPTHWIFKVAAVLAVALLGVSVKQANDLADREQQITVQASRIAELNRVMADFVPAGVPDWMAASGTELCELRPQAAEAEGSKGWLFVRSDHQHWYVAVEGLAPCPEGHVYELWFIADGKPVSGGTFEPGPDGRVTLTSETMPTGITGIAITLEPMDGDHSKPSDKTVLYGDEVMLTL